MRRRFAATLLCILAAAVPASAQRLAVVSRADNALVVHQLPSGAEVRRFLVGMSPHEVALDPTGRFAFLASYGGNTVHAVDLSSGEVTKFALAGHRALHGIAASRRGALLWVTAEESGAVLEISATTGAVVRVWPTNGEQSHMVTASLDDRKLYVANMVTGSVSVIDRQTEVTTSIETGSGTEGIAISPDGSEVWVSNRGDNTLSVIATTTDQVVATFASGGAFPVKVRFRPDGDEVWVANNQSGSVAVFERRSRRLIATVPVGPRPLGIAFSGDGRHAYVTRPGDNEIVEIDAVTHGIVRRIRTGGSPDGVAWIP